MDLIKYTSLFANISNGVMHCGNVVLGEFDQGTLHLCVAAVAAAALSGVLRYCLSSTFCHTRLHPTAPPSLPSVT